MKKELITDKDPKSPISETFRTLRTNIQFTGMSKKIKTLLITSTLPTEGKSWVASNLAVTFAQAGKRVIVLDGDMRKGRQFSIFDVSPRPGLSNYLSGIDDYNNEIENDNIENYIQETQVENLYIIPAGNVPPNPSELLITAKMVNLIEKLKTICDILIVDGTPCQLVTDSVILSRLVDSTIVVVAHMQTKKDDLQNTVKSIQNVGGKIAGIVLNKIPVESKKYNEAYYYGNRTIGKRRSEKNNRKKESYKNKKSNRDYIIEPIKIDNLEFNDKKEAEDLPNSLLNKVSAKEPKTNRANESTSDKKVHHNIDVYNSEIPESEETDKRTEDILNQINSYLNNQKNNHR